MPSIASLTAKRTKIVSKRIKTAGVAAKAATTATGKTAKKAATKELKHLVVEQRVVTEQIKHRQEFDAKATATATPADRARKAKPPGKRTSKSGKTYFESRTNRADSSGKKRI